MRGALNKRVTRSKRACSPLGELGFLRVLAAWARVRLAGRGLDSVSVAAWMAARPGLTYRCTDRRPLCPVLAMITLAETLASLRWVAEECLSWCSLRPSAAQ